jgi:hypothetical protein
MVCYEITPQINELMSVQLVQHGKQLEMDYNAHIAQSQEVYPNIQSHLQQFVQLSKVSILLKLLISHVVTLGLNMCPSNMVRAQFVSVVLELTFILDDHNHSCFERQYFQPVRDLTLHADNNREQQIEGRSQTCIRREIYSSHCYIPFFTNLK